MQVKNISFVIHLFSSLFKLIWEDKQASEKCYMMSQPETYSNSLSKKKFYRIQIRKLGYYYAVVGKSKQNWMFLLSVHCARKYLVQNVQHHHENSASCPELNCSLKLLKGQINRGHTNKITIPPPQRATVRKMSPVKPDEFLYSDTIGYESYAVCSSCLVMKESLKVTLTGNQETLLSTEIFLPTFCNGVYSIKKILKKNNWKCDLSTTKADTCILDVGCSIFFCKLVYLDFLFPKNDLILHQLIKHVVQSCTI